MLLNFASAVLRVSVGLPLAAKFVPTEHCVQRYMVSNPHCFALRSPTCLVHCFQRQARFQVFLGAFLCSNFNYRRTHSYHRSQIASKSLLERLPAAWAQLSTFDGQIGQLWVNVSWNLSPLIPTQLFVQGSEASAWSLKKCAWCVKAPP